MTLFEKIYFTVAIFNLFLAIAGMCIKLVNDDDHDNIGWKIGTIFVIPMIVQMLFLVIGEAFICKLILTGIWELDISIFPSMWR